MNNQFAKLDESLRREADKLLYDKGLLGILSRYGTPHIQGSYKLHLMVWRDLDLYLESESITFADFFTMGAEIAETLRAGKVQINNTFWRPVEGLPPGFYCGVVLDTDPEHAWKVDIWALSREECRRLLRVGDDIAARLTPRNRRTIMEIKSQCWQHPLYRRGIYSMDIYTAVLDDGVTDLAAFKDYLRRTKAVEM